MKIRNCARCQKSFEKQFNNQKYCSECKDLAAKENKRQLDKSYKFKNKEKIEKQNKEYRKNNREQIRERDRKFYSLNRDKRLANSKNSPNKKINRSNSQKRKRMDPVFKLHQNISFAINKAIKRTANAKNGSILNHLPYSIEVLKNHLENQFESWMNWNNWGPYNKNIWNDDDSGTWTWNIDHIVPKSHFYYSSMADDDFKECWSLKNLRPYSAKQNIIDQNER